MRATERTKIAVMQPARLSWWAGCFPGATPQQKHTQITETSPWTQFQRTGAARHQLTCSRKMVWEACVRVLLRPTPWPLPPLKLHSSVSARGERRLRGHKKLEGLRSSAANVQFVCSCSRLLNERNEREWHQQHWRPRALLHRRQLRLAARHGPAGLQWFSARRGPDAVSGIQSKFGFQMIAKSA